MIDEQKLRELAEAAEQDGAHVYTNPRDSNKWQDNEEWHHVASPATILDLLDELATLRQERTAWRVTAENAEKDAARYRWLLANYARGDGYDAIDQALNDGEPDTQLSPAIDAAIAAATKETP